jgi:sulfur-carrier protein
MNQTVNESMTVTVNVKYFASVREALGKDSDTVNTRASTVSELRAELMAQGEPYASALGNPRVRAALNHAMIAQDAGLSPGDEVAFFPPVTGG